MKKVLFALLISISLFSCKKDAAPSTDSSHVKSLYSVYLIGKGDTTKLPDMFARMETTGLASAEDSKLKAVLTGYQNVGGKAYYTLQVTNLQACQMIIRWDWEEIGVTSIVPTDTTGGRAQYDVIKANQTKTYIIVGLIKPGKIKLQAKQSNSGCPNSSTLIIYITNAILPVKVTEHQADYNETTKKVTISFNVEEPELFDWILIYKEGKEAAVIATDHTTKSYSIKL